MALPAGSLPSGAAALAPSSPTLLTTGFAGKVVSMAMVEGTKTPAPRLGFAPIARWKGRNRPGGRPEPGLRGDASEDGR